MSTPTPRAALKRLIELEDAASANGADPDMTAWDDAVAAGRAALNTEPDRPTLAEAALCALERIQHGDASSGSDDFDLVANALGQLRRYDAIPPAPAEAGSDLTLQSAIHAFRSQLTKEASSRYGLTFQDAEFDAFTSGASWAWVTYATATAGGFGQAPQAGEGE